MEEFIKKYSHLPQNFIRDFYNIAKEDYDDKEPLINFDIVCKWLNVKKGNLKRTLIKNFVVDFDYTIYIKKIIKSDGGATRKEIINISPDCFKILCMLSQTEKAKGVRLYFLELEKLVKRYHKEIHEKILKEFELVKKNQKPLTEEKRIIKGKVYVVQAQNTEMTLNKIGKSKDLKKRLKGYNTGNANDIEPLFELEVDDIRGVENCVKKYAKKYQYRKYKEVYEASVEMLGKIMENCNEFLKKIKKIYEENDKKIKNTISRMKKSKGNIFICIYEDEESLESSSDETDSSEDIKPKKK